MRYNILKIKIYALIFASVLLNAVCSFGADVNIFSEGAYTDKNSNNDFVLYIYANINTTSLRSFGLLVNYNNSDIINPTIVINDSIWYLGDGTSAGNYKYPAPDTDILGKIVFAGGKLDVNNPASGVDPGQRILLGTITFDRVSENTPSITISLNNTENYKNFVDINGSVLDDKIDGIIFSPALIAIRGDANADGIFSRADITIIKTYYNNGTYKCFADCNYDNTINRKDIRCVRNLQ